LEVIRALRRAKTMVTLPTAAMRADTLAQHLQPHTNLVDQLTLLITLLNNTANNRPMARTSPPTHPIQAMVTPNTHNNLTDSLQLNNHMVEHNNLLMVQLVNINNLALEESNTRIHTEVMVHLNNIHRHPITMAALGTDPLQEVNHSISNTKVVIMELERHQCRWDYTQVMVNNLFNTRMGKRLEDILDSRDGNLIGLTGLL